MLESSHKTDCHAFFIWRRREKAVRACYAASIMLPLLLDSLTSTINISLSFCVPSHLSLFHLEANSLFQLFYFNQVLSRVKRKESRGNKRKKTQHPVKNAISLTEMIKEKSVKILVL